MCGIAGSVGVIAFDPAVARRSLAHRGPDGYGVIVSGRGADAVRLAHTRLAIQDLSSAGLQPMRSRCGRYLLAFNGEIYNFRELAFALRREDGVALRSRSDSEVLVEGLARHGMTFVDRCRGMFAFALWDDRDKELWLVRDRLGVKPLYFVRGSANSIAFASEVRTLVASGAATGRWDPEGVASFLAWGAVEEPGTILEGIEAVPAGSYLRFKKGTLTQGSYWSLPARTEPTEHADALSVIRERFVEAVRFRLVSDVEVGVLLSGGIDSSAIAAVAAHERGGDLDAFTIALGDQAPALDEAAKAAGFAGALGIRHHLVHVSAADVLGRVTSAFAAMDQPTLDGINTWIVSEALRARGIRVALSGLGGDELFLGYPSARALPERLAILSRARPILARSQGLLRRLPLSARRIPPRWQKLLDVADLHPSPESVVRFRRLLFAHAAREALLGRSLASARRWEESIDRDLTLRWSRAELEGYTRNMLLRDADVFGMAHPVEIRTPFLDHRLVETVLRLPDLVRTSSRRPKGLLLEALGDRRLDEVGQRPKRGFVLPIDRWLVGPLRARVDAMVRDRSGWEELGLVPEAVSDVWTQFGRHPSMASATRMWALYALGAFRAQMRRAGEDAR